MAIFLCLVTLPIMLGTWIASFAPFDDLVDQTGKPLTTDFLCFYLAGDCVNSGRLEHLYNDADANQRAVQLFPHLAVWGGAGLPYRYPPLIGLLAAPLARLPYPQACIAFLALQVTLLTGMFLWWRHELPALKNVHFGLFLLASFGFPMVSECLMCGQLSVFTFVFVSGAILLLRKGHDVSAGLLLGMTVFKPNIAILLIAGLVLKHPRMLIGLSVTGLTFLAANVLTLGSGPLWEFVELMRTLSSHRWQTSAPFVKIQGLEPYLAVIAGQKSRLVTLSLGLVASISVSWLWKREKLTDATGLSLLLMTNALFGMYVPIYDLLLLLPVLYLLAHELEHRRLSVPGQPWTLAQPKVLPALGVLIVLGPHLSQALVTHSGYHLFPPLLLLAAVAGACYAVRVTRATDSCSTPPFSLQSP